MDDGAANPPGPAARPATSLDPAATNPPGPVLTATIWALLAAHAVARVLLAAMPSMAAWGLNVGRFLDPAIAWALWACMALALVPPVAGFLARRLEPIGDALVDSARARLALGIGVALLVFALADRTWFLGDFLQRVDAAESLDVFSGNFVAALPLDFLLHVVVAGLLNAALGTAGTLSTRIFGAIEAGLLATVAVSLARSLDRRGMIAVLVVCVVLFTGCLTMFTGLGKPASEMCLLTAWMGSSAVHVVRKGRGHAGLGVALALAVLTHRSGILLVPVWAFTWLVSMRSAMRGPRRAAALGLGLVLPIAAGAIVMPRIAGLGANFDLSHHFLTVDVVRQGGMLAAAFESRRLADIANLIVVVSPAILLLPLVLVARGRRLLASPEVHVLAVLALSVAPVWLFVHPQQGVFRDWDVFAAAGVSLGLLTACALTATLDGTARHRWLAASITVTVIVSSLAWLVHFHDSRRGIERVRAYAEESRLQPEWVRALTWDFLMQRGLRLKQWDIAAEAASHAATLAPHRRVLLTWGIAESMSGDDRTAERVYQRLLDRDPDDALAWLGLGGAALRLGDTLQTRRAITKLRSYAPDGREAREIRRHLRYFPGVWPGPPPLENKIARPG